MSDEQQKTDFEFDLGDRGDRLAFSSPQDLQNWTSQEFAKWQWLSQVPHGGLIFNDHGNLHNQIAQQVSQWTNAQTNVPQLQNVFANLRNIFQQFYMDRRIFNSTSPEGFWILELLQKRGNVVAVGAYYTLLGRDMPGPSNQPKFLEGMIEAFLYSREIDWTATAHQETLNRLKNQYAGNISHQDSRLKEVENQNKILNTSFQELLTAKTDSLEKLHEAQTSEFQQLIEKHVGNLQAIEQAYDQKLALQKPVEYWETKRKYHGRRAVAFGCVSLLASILVAIALAGVIHWALSGLGANESPKQWQLGIIVVSTFFAVWFVRILVRLFFSHHHLATDAAERSTMILTYLALAREGSQYAAEDKRLILEHIFRTASDGLVKDDAAPPTLIEMLTRK